MDRESPELIEQEMEATRASLTHKVAELENTVLGTIQNASQTVSNIVETVKHAVPETIHSVKDTLTESVSEVSQKMKSALDIPQHTREHPWAMVGGAAALGFVTGLVVFRPSGPSFSRLARSSPEPHGGPASTMPPVTPTAATMPTTGHAAVGSFGGTHAGPAVPGWVSLLMDKLGADALLDKAAHELRTVAEAAIASAADCLRQTVQEGLPKLIGPDALGVHCQHGGGAAGGPTGAPPNRGGMI